MNTIATGLHASSLSRTPLVLSVLTSFMLMFTIAGAGNTAVLEKQLQIDFSFDTGAIPGKQVTGYRLYRDNEFICASAQGQTFSLVCDVSIEPGTYDFTLSAVYDDDSESPQSGSFPFTFTGPGDINGDGLVDLKDIIIGLQVLVNLSPEAITLQSDINGDGRVGYEEVFYCLNEAL